MDAQGSMGRAKLTVRQVALIACTSLLLSASLLSLGARAARASEMTVSARSISRPAGTRTPYAPGVVNVSRADPTKLISGIPASSALFSPRSYRNAALPARSRLDPNQSYAAGLLSQVHEFGTWVNTTTWSAPLYVVPASTPLTSVLLDSRWPYFSPQEQGYFQSDGQNVPLPADALSAAPLDGSDDRDIGSSRPWSPTWTDRELVLYQPATDSAWEFYHLVWHLGAWRATQIGKISQVSQNRGHYDAWPDNAAHGVTASRIPLLATMQTLAELHAGSINHMIGIAVPHVALSTKAHPNFRAPATDSDGNDAIDADAIPEGTRFRLPASLNVDALGLSPYATMVAKAVQRYGMVVQDRDCSLKASEPCPAVSFFAQEPRPYPGAGVSNPYDAIFRGLQPNQAGALRGFPWDRLQVLPPAA